MSFMNRTSNSLGLFAAGSIAAALMTIAPSASADEGSYDYQSDPNAATIAEPSAPAPGTVPANKGFQMALSFGYSIPFGDVDSSLKQGDLISSELPLNLEFGYKVTPEIYFGGYVGYGFGDGGSMVDKLCISSSVTCSLSTLRIGVNLQYHFRPEAKVNPYIGFGMGYESATFTASGPGGTAEVIARGFEVLRFTAGTDFRTNSVVGFGPYVNLGVGTYTSLDNGYESAPIEDAKLHGWLNVGIRISLFP